MSDKVTGDITNFKAVEKKGVTLHNFPTVAIADLQDKDNIVNASSQSGKRLGAQLMGVTADTNATIFVAAGSDVTAKWVAVKDVIGTTADITPA
ncbi:acetyl-CoA acetyltransferase [Vibrio phage D529]